MANISFKQYRTTDLVILTVIIAVCEALAVTAASKWFPSELYTLSPTVAMVCIVMMRWSGFAAVQAIAGGLAFCAATGATAQQFAVYCIGNCFALIAMVLFKIYGKEKIRTKIPFTIIFTVVSFCLVQVGRWLVSLVFGAELDSILSFFAADSLSLPFSVVVVLIARRADGLFEDQKSYLIRTEEQRRREQNGEIL